MAESRTIEQVVLSLAEKTVPCPGSNERELGGCVLCHSTGWIAEFSMLRRPCSFNNDEGDGIAWPGTSGERICEGCQGRGWLPVCTTDALLEAGKPWQLGIHWNGDDWTAAWWEVGRFQDHYVRDAGKEMALALALEEAT